jgi:hypothetical protein
MNSALPSATPDFAPVLRALGDVAGAQPTRRFAACSQPVASMIDGHVLRSEGIYARVANHVFHSVEAVEATPPPACSPGKARLRRATDL